MKDIEIKEYMDEQFSKLETKQRNRQQWLTTVIVFIIIALISSGYMNARAIGGIQVKTEMISEKYVPGDLLWVVMYSYDLQNEFTLSLLNGNREGAEEKFKEFVQFRKDMYEKYFQTRGVSLTEGCTAIKQ